MKNLIKSKKMWIAFSIVFLSGIAIGIVVGMALERPTSKKERKHQGMMKMRILRHMSDELQLTPDQKVNVDKIITGMTEKISALHYEQRPKIKNIIEGAFTEIDQILTDEQKEKMAKLKKKMNKFRKMHNNRERRKRNEHREGDQFRPPMRREGSVGRKRSHPDGDDRKRRERENHGEKRPRRYKKRPGNNDYPERKRHTPPSIPEKEH